MSSPTFSHNPTLAGSPRQVPIDNPIPTSRTFQETDASTHIYLRNLANLVSSRLPKAFPPYASDPSLFAAGLLYFAPIFSAVTEIWRKQISDNDEDVDPKDDAVPCNPTAASAIQPLIKILIERERGMRVDLSDLCGWDAGDLDRELSAMMAENAFLGDIVSHISDACAANGNVLLGYCYTLLESMRLTSDHLRPKMPHTVSNGTATAPASGPASGTATPNSAAAAAAATFTPPPPEFWQKRCSALCPMAPNLVSRRTGHVRVQPVIAMCMTAERSAERQQLIVTAFQKADLVLDDNQAKEVTEEARFLAQSLIKIVQELDMICWNTVPAAKSSAKGGVASSTKGTRAPAPALAAGGVGLAGTGPDGKRKGHPRRAARDSVQLNRERKWCVAGLDELGLRMAYDLQAGSGTDGLGSGENAVPRVDAHSTGTRISGEEGLPVSENASETEDDLCASIRRTRLVKFDNVLPHRESD
ncbi:HEM oxygenase-like, multi-helical [Ceratocystis lukuohia]|uniref:HEM oxygenase-like, multi-helical n=1 Tax=Ceratocystis lukuohia TaxID=2019550 RepID=A0ABR4MKB1_9PEZI